MTTIVQMYKGNAALYHQYQGHEENGRKFNFRRQARKYYFSLNQPAFFPSIQSILEQFEIVDVQINNEI